MYSTYVGGWARIAERTQGTARDIRRRPRSRVGERAAGLLSQSPAEGASRIHRKQRPLPTYVQNVMQIVVRRVPALTIPLGGWVASYERDKAPILFSAVFFDAIFCAKKKGATCCTVGIDKGDNKNVVRLKTPLR